MGTVIFSVMLAVFLLTAALLSKEGEKAALQKSRLEQIRLAKGVPDEASGEKQLFLKKAMLSLKDRQESKLRATQKENRQNGGRYQLLEQQLQLADIPLTPVQFLLLRLSCGILCSVLGLTAAIKTGLTDMVLLIMGASLISGLILPQKLLESRVGKHQEIYRHALPDVMDLLVVSVEAGLGFDAALLRLYEKDKSPLMEELIRTVHDVHRGMSKKEAYSNMCERCQVKEITSFLNALLQAEQMGISIISVLKAQAEQLREDRRQAAEEKALKAPVAMLLPLVIFIFPVIFIILLGPAVMNIMEVFA